MSAVPTEFEGRVFISGTLILSTQSDKFNPQTHLYAAVTFRL